MRRPGRLRAGLAPAVRPRLEGRDVRSWEGSGKRRVALPWFTPDGVFAPEFCKKTSREQGQEVGTLLLDLRGGAGAVKGDDLRQGRPELLASPGVFVVQRRRVGLPAAGDLADRQPLVKPKAQQLDPL